MLKVLKPQAATLALIQELRSKFRRWWLAMTNEEQRDIVVRGAMMAVCAVAATVTLPAIGFIQADKRADADYREQAMRLAQMEDGGLAARAPGHTPALLDSPWLRTVEYSLKRDTDASLSRYAMRDRDGAALASLITFKPEHLAAAESIDREAHCMAQAVYYESAREPLEGQLAVAEVVANRMRDHRYPDTACDVVFQGATRTTGCQFTFTCDGALKIAPKGANWARAKTIAAHVMMNLNEVRTAGATHYHATYVDPVWSEGLIKTDQIGVHVFYRFPRGAEWATVRQDFTSGSKTPAIVRVADAVNEAPDPELFDTDTDAGLTEAPRHEDAFQLSAAPAQTVTSTRSVSFGAPRLTTIRTVTQTAAFTPTAETADTANGAMQ
jgi:Cell Wall Hydrolase